VGSLVTPDNSGAYTISNVFSGTYTIEVSLDGYTAGTITVVVGNTDPVNQNITLEPGGPAPITGKTLKAALDEVKIKPSGAYTVKLGQDETGLTPYNISGFQTPVTITVDGAKAGGGTCTIGWALNTTSASGNITVRSGVTLILKNVAFQGNSEPTNTASLVRVESGGVFKMEAGALLTGNKATNGGGVFVNTGGSFEMSGGSITGNTSGSGGNGVIVNGGSMAMSGGSIHGNTYSTNPSYINDVYLVASAAAQEVLRLSGDARIGRICLNFASSKYAVIAIPAALNGSGTVATIDLYTTSFNGKQILTGSGVSSSYDRFGLGRCGSSVRYGSTSGTDISGGSISSAGVVSW
jgi:hypothetical protein